MKATIIRALFLAGVASVFTVTAAAEHRGVLVGGRLEFRTFGSPSGFGNVVFPGTGTAPRVLNPFSFPSSFAQRLGATVSGFPGYTGAPSIDPFFRRQPAVIPYAYPVYVGGYYPMDQPAYQQPPNVTIVMPPQPAGYAQPAPPVTIHQHFGPEPARSVIREYPPSEPDSSVRTYEAPAPKPVEPSPEQDLIFLIALKDSSVYSAAAYWVEGDTLHYITTQGKHNQVSLDLVDRAVSEKLNRGRRVEFRLPPAKK